MMTFVILVLTALVIFFAQDATATDLTDAEYHEQMEYIGDLLSTQCPIQIDKMTTTLSIKYDIPTGTMVYVFEIDRNKEDLTAVQWAKFVKQQKKILRKNGVAADWKEKVFRVMDLKITYKYQTYDEKPIFEYTHSVKTRKWS
jgi:hypothetical protein